MAHYIYLSMIPESLVISMLPPAEFGSYLAVGTQKRANEQALFFELSSDFESEYFDIQNAMQQCVPHEDGQPKHTVYVSVYRVLEHVPMKAFKSLWLVTRDGLTLELNQGSLPKSYEQDNYLYQELCPVHPLVASKLTPADFCKFITDPEGGISLPKVCFLDMQLGNLASEGVKKSVSNLPYKKIDHIRDCLVELSGKNKTTKTVDRIYEQHMLFRCIESGYYVGNYDTILHYPFPSAEELEKYHHRWWRSAQLPE